MRDCCGTCQLKPTRGPTFPTEVAFSLIVLLLFLVTPSGTVNGKFDGTTSPASVPLAGKLLVASAGRKLSSRPGASDTAPKLSQRRPRFTVKWDDPLKSSWKYPSKSGTRNECVVPPHEPLEVLMLLKALPFCAALIPKMKSG